MDSILVRELTFCKPWGVAKTKPGRWAASHRFKGDQMRGKRKGGMEAKIGRV